MPFTNKTAGAYLPPRLSSDATKKPKMNFRRFGNGSQMLPDESAPLRVCVENIPPISICDEPTNRQY
jgi:hypothetical protein